MLKLRPHAASDAALEAVEAGGRSPNRQTNEAEHAHAENCECMQQCMEGFSSIVPWLIALDLDVLDSIDTVEFRIKEFTDLLSLSWIIFY
eukprot:COSAG05_NODE_1292_length_5262_cov_2.550068_3_plen_90_part_00